MASIAGGYATATSIINGVFFFFLCVILVDYTTN